MFTKNWYRMIYGRSANLSFAEAGLVDIRGKESTDTSTFTGSWTYGTVFNSSYYNTASPYLGRFIKSNNPMNYNSFGGVAFGDGTTPPTLDDYTFSGNIHYQYAENYSLTKGVDENGVYVTALYTITNTGTEDMRISEIGIFMGANSVIQFMFERTVLDAPITIEPGGVGQVTYTIRMNYPTA